MIIRCDTTIIIVGPTSVYPSFINVIGIVLSLAARYRVEHLVIFSAFGALIINKARFNCREILIRQAANGNVHFRNPQFASRKINRCYNLPLVKFVTRTAISIGSL